MKNKTKIWTGLILTIFLVGTIFNICLGKYNNLLSATETEEEKIKEKEKEKEKANSAILPAGLKEAMEISFQKGAEWPENVLLNNITMKIEYYFDEKLTNFTKLLLKQYRSDYSAITVIDNETGKVLVAVGYDRKMNGFDKNLIMTSTHPSASLIKMVTTAELLQNSLVRKGTIFDYRGRSTTLFKYQLNSTRGNRWDKSQTFETAFAKSNNVIFGKAAINNTTSENLVKMAEGFGFNQPLMSEFEFLKSEIHAVSGKNDFALAELASGFNVETVISPIHAAAMASVVANDGMYIKPKLLAKIIDPKTGENILPESITQSRAIDHETAVEMHDMMSTTVDDGTARRSFRRMNSLFRNVLDIGGKTGSITGGIPYGKRDWFAVFAVPKEKSKGKGISISVMNVNVRKWHVRSSLLAKNIIEYYYKNINPIAADLNNSTKRAPSESSPLKKKRRHRKKNV